MLEIVPKAWFSHDYQLVENGILIADLHRNWFREQGMLTIQGVEYSIRKQFGGGVYTLECGGEVVARAEKPSAFSRVIEVDYRGLHYTLQPASMWRRTFLLQVNGQTIGSIGPKNTWSRKAQVDFPPAIPLHLTIFMTWMVVILWQREEAAASSGA